MNKLPDIAPTAGDLATAHARRIQIAVNRLIATLGYSYIDHPSQPSRAARLKNGQDVQVAALPPVALADIQSRLGPSRAVVDSIISAIDGHPS